MKKQTFNALKRKLDLLNINYTIRKSNYTDVQVLVISDENQPEDVYITDWNYDSELNECLNDVKKWLEDRGYNFECEYSGTFTLCLDY